MQLFSDEEVTLISLKEQLDFSSTSGRLISNFLALLTQFEHDVLTDRVREGIASARSRGRIGGRPAVNPKIITKAVDMYDKHNLTVAEICRACEISRPTLYKALRQREEKEQLGE